MRWCVACCKTRLSRSSFQSRFHPFILNLPRLAFSRSLKIRSTSQIFDMRRPHWNCKSATASPYRSKFARLISPVSRIIIHEKYTNIRALSAGPIVFIPTIRLIGLDSFSVHRLYSTKHWNPLIGRAFVIWKTIKAVSCNGNGDFQTVVES